MKPGIPNLTLGLISLAVMTLTACGGGGSSGSAGGTSGGVGPNTGVAMTAVTTTVMDGLIRNALVCVDSNNNGMCEAGETQGHTDANGKVTLEVPTANLSSTRLIAVVGTDATDADSGPVRTAYTMSTPPGQLSVISPLTTMVQTKMDQDQVSVQVAESYVKAQTGLNISMFDNFVAQRATSAEHKKAGDVARLLVLSTQKSKESGTTDADRSCLSGKSSQEAEHIKETHINEGLLSSLSVVRNYSDGNDNDGNDNDRNDKDDNDGRTQSGLVVVPICGTTGTTPTTPTTPTPASTASALSGKTLYAEAVRHATAATRL
jgi:hypothetical protein